MLHFAESTFKSAYNRTFYGKVVHILQRYRYDILADISGGRKWDLRNVELNKIPIYMIRQ